MQLYAPNGKRIIGLLERVPCVSPICNATRNEAGELQLEFDGEIRLDWDMQEPFKTADGQCQYVDEDGGVHPENTLTIKED